MRAARVIGLMAVLIAAVAAVAVWAPGALGQVVIRGSGSPDGERHLEIFGGGGSQIGVSVRDVDAADVKREKLPAMAGVVIDEVASEGPAEKAGLKAGDVVVEFDGESVRSARQFARLVDETPAGREVRASVIRGGERVPVQITPRDDSAPAFSMRGMEFLRRRHPGGGTFSLEMPHIEMPEFDFHMSQRPSRLGVSVQELPPQLAEYFGVKEGVLVTAVSEESAAARAGIKAGDVITAVNGETIDSSSDLRRRLAEVDTGEVTVGVVRDRKTLSLKVTLPDRSERIRQRTLRRMVSGAPRNHPLSISLIHQTAPSPRSVSPWETAGFPPAQRGSA